MPSTDSLADLLVAIRNASMAQLDTARVSDSRFRQAVLRVLQAEGFIKSFRVTSGNAPQRLLEIQLNYGPKRERLFLGAKRISRPGRRVYAGMNELAPYLRKMEILLISTPSGVMTGAQALARKTGGELLCQVW